MHGAANDYLFVDARGMERDWSRLAVAMSDRHRGAGSDGLILALPSERAQVRMKMFNADGSNGEMCGNGIRCLVSFALSKGIVPSGASPVVVETDVGDRTVTPIWANGRMTRATVDMGEPMFATQDIPAIAPGHEKLLDYPLTVDGHRFKVSCLSMGNPHAVTFMDSPVGELQLDEVGPMVENNAMFPKRANFEVANVIDEGHVTARVWERGSGLTMACGTGACAVGVIGRLKGLTGDEVTVSLPGGDLLVKWPGSGAVLMEGPVEDVFEGEWPD